MKIILLTILLLLSPKLFAYEKVTKFEKLIQMAPVYALGASYYIDLDPQENTTYGQINAMVYTMQTMDIIPNLSLSLLGVGLGIGGSRFPPTLTMSPVALMFNRNFGLSYNWNLDFDEQGLGLVYQF